MERLSQKNRGLVRLRARNQVTLPDWLVRRMGLAEGDLLDLTSSETGMAQLRPARIVTVGTGEALEEEAAAEEDIRQGRYSVIASPEDVEPYLDRVLKGIQTFDRAPSTAEDQALPKVETKARKAADSTEQPVGETTGSAHIDDNFLIRQAQGGNAAAFEQLVRKYDTPVLRLALHLTGSERDAQDLYQDAFLKAYKNIGNFRFECSFYTWIHRIVTNLSIDLRRRKQAGGDKQNPRLTSPKESSTYRQAGEFIASALEKLTPRERAVLSRLLANQQDENRERGSHDRDVVDSSSHAPPFNEAVIEAIRKERMSEKDSSPSILPGHAKNRLE